MPGRSRTEAKCPVCGHEQPCNWDVPMFDPPKCNRCGNYMRPKEYGRGFGIFTPKYT